MRVATTEDKDFGELVYAHGARSCGVVLLRYQPAARITIERMMLDLAEQRGEKLMSEFVVVSPGKIRVNLNFHTRTLPPDSLDAP